MNDTDLNDAILNSIRKYGVPRVPPPSPWHGRYWDRNEELRAAYEASRPAVRAYRKAAGQYRAKEIGDDAFLAARKARDEACAIYDALEAAYIEESRVPKETR